MDLSNIPVLDNHCHFFGLEVPEQPLHRMLTLSLNNMPDDQLRHSMVYRMMLAELSEVLKCSADEQHVLATRRELSQRDYPAYVKLLLDDALIKGLVVDIGLQKSLVDNTQFETMVARKVWYVFRIETIVDRLWREQVEPGVGLDQFKAEIGNAVRTLPAIALKSIVGYRTGLRIDPSMTVAKASKAGNEASYRNLFFLESARICREMGIPLHVHAAFGESNLDLRENNPLHLKPFLDSPLGREVDLLLIHAGYPFAFEAGYLAAMHPRVYVDISELVPFATFGMKRGVEDVMSMCPWNKIMYGSDGFDIPETHWLGARMGKRVIASILDDLIHTGTIDSVYGEEIARMIFCDNSLALHKNRPQGEESFF